MASGRGRSTYDPALKARGLGRPSSRKLVPSRRRPPFSSSSRIGHRRRPTGRTIVGLEDAGAEPQCPIGRPGPRRSTFSGAGRRSPSSLDDPHGQERGLGAPHRWSPDDHSCLPCCQRLACCADEPEEGLRSCLPALDHSSDRSTYPTHGIGGLDYAAEAVPGYRAPWPPARPSCLWSCWTKPGPCSGAQPHRPLAASHLPIA